ncbi:hypothetical protein P3T76_007548 [Phytophthora citrophthora]|uniref:Bzip transcription factor n=1 Tax=Phytophthora citrophthora TaxID=4793 RepID=A0AAD9GLV9_9STRA|nr:hypothetical protein P3T76_007548 [Phytophthora citrophthora]
MASDVMINGRQGVEASLADWKHVSLCFGNVEMRLESLHRGSGDTLIALTSTSISIMTKTLENVFPHLLLKEPITLADKLLGKTIVMRGSAIFEWDSACGHVTSITNHSDMLIPVLRILENVSDASVVFEKSPLSPDFQWR